MHHTGSDNIFIKVQEEAIYSPFWVGSVLTTTSSLDHWRDALEATCIFRAPLSALMGV
jgi:hypothetical protein